MADYNCKCDPGFPNGITGPIVPFWGFSAFTPTIPKLYWDVKSQEQRILNLFDLLNKLICYANNMGAQIDVNAKDISDLKVEFEKFKESGFEDYYEAQLEAWLKANQERIIKDMLLIGVSFGITEDGYWCAYIPETWDDVTFDTGGVYGRSDYMHLLLRYEDTRGADVTDNTYAFSMANISNAGKVMGDVELTAKQSADSHDALFTPVDQPVTRRISGTEGI